VIGKIINQKLLADEIATGETEIATEILPKVVQLINQNYAHEAKPTDPTDPICSTGNYTENFAREIYVGRKK
jgi:hypothetical protein